MTQDTSPRKVAVISYHVLELNGRLRSLTSMLEHIGQVVVISCSSDKAAVSTSRVRYPDTARFTIAHMAGFLHHVWRNRRILDGADVILIDDIYASPAALLMRRRLKQKFVIQDCRELYLRHELSSWRAKSFSTAEVLSLKNANLVMCASEERSSIMKRVYGLDTEPLVFENVRRLPPAEVPPSPVRDAVLNIPRGRTRIVASGGYSTQRRTLDLIRRVGSLGPSASLLIAGGGSTDDRRAALEAARDSGCDLHLLEVLEPAHLSWVLERSDVGVVSYHREDSNNEFCASGKIYEYLDAGLPIVTTENPPLSRFCSVHGVGVADDGFATGLRTVISALPTFREAVSVFMMATDVFDEEWRVSQEIMKRLVSSPSVDLI